MTLTFRQAEEADAQIIADAEFRTAETPGLLNALPGEIPVAAFRDKIRAMAEDPRGLYLVAERDGAIVGHLLLDPLPLAQNSHVVSLNIVVHPGATDRGIGRQLLVHAIDWAQRNPAVEKIELRVRAGNARALHLYRTLGFEEEGRLRRRLKLADGSYGDDIIMGLLVAGDQG